MRDLAFAALLITISCLSVIVALVIRGNTEPVLTVGMLAAVAALVFATTGDRDSLRRSGEPRDRAEEGDR